ncbi:homeobox protein Hox-C12a [Carcharodon carcharias]|uniref:homeobox protein Hox-C12a n=1 Tax=Carcharodon carcharias TaxID=13397 RepID=UPI001B7EE7E8|nr:homeobox protein Hox-C12a [Carcharodon carcharias]
MADPTLLNAGLLGPLLNVHTGDAFYIPNFRASGAQLAALPPLPYSRRDGVCSLPWAAGVDPPCSGYPQPYLGGPPPVALDPSFDARRSDEAGGKVPYPPRESAADAMKREERDGEPGSALHDPSGLGYPSHPGGTETLARSHSRWESDSLSPLVNGGDRNPAVSPPPADHGAGLVGEGPTPWYPLHSRTRKKRRPYSKVQIAELEGEFMLNEFITRQRRRELSDRLTLSDQQVKIWFQNRRMKKKRQLIREQALSFF